MVAPLVVPCLCLWLGISLVGKWLAAARQACQDRRGPQSAGWFGSGIEGWMSQSTSWHQYFLFDALCIQVRREPYWSIWTVGTLWKRRCKFSTMTVFPVVCGRPTWHLWSQHAVIMLRDEQYGPLIIFPKKSICQVAIIFLMQGME